MPPTITTADWLRRVADAWSEADATQDGEARRDTADLEGEPHFRQCRSRPTADRLAAASQRGRDLAGERFDICA
jgi:hypothetical protein